MPSTLNLKRRNLLLRILAVQEAYQRHKTHEGVTDAWVFREHIYPIFYISRSTFLKYLETNAKKELSQIEEYLKQQKQPCEPSE